MPNDALPPIEHEIGKRLRQFREEFLGCSRVAFVEFIDEGSEKIAAYEAGRAAVTWSVFAKIWKTFHLSPFWLARGKGGFQWGDAATQAKYSAPRPEMRFSDVYTLLFEAAAPSADDLKNAQLKEGVAKMEKFIAEAKAGKIEIGTVQAVAAKASAAAASRNSATA